ncbi:MAG: phenylalanine--tRNA ligase subunit beta, partial [candidate division Zixibacteria bacterium]|nr:phenylalanine--tRNA ligase subunit beta [candidate division Zixibacteria bacterium]
MKVSYNWICELAQVNWSPEEMSDRLTAAGTACEDIVSLSEKFENIVVGHIVSVSDVPGSDKLKSAQVDLGDGQHTILCGAPNIATDLKTPVARIGAVLPSGARVESVTHFGVESHGIILSEAELELSEDHSGIMV